MLTIGIAPNSQINPVTGRLWLLWERNAQKIDKFVLVVCYTASTLFRDDEQIHLSVNKQCEEKYTRATYRSQLRT